jgi:putative peptidoglycan lipid II flippase
MFPEFSALAAKDDKQAFAMSLSRSVKILSYVTIPMALGLVAVSSPLVSLVYERGNFTELSTALTGKALLYFSLGIPGFGLMTILSRGFYAMQKGKTPMIAGFAAMGANLLLSFGLVGALGPGGPALASSISMTLAALGMLFAMSRSVPGLLKRKMASETLKMVVCAAVSAGLAGFMQWNLSLLLPGAFIMRALTLGASFCAGALLYIALTLLMRQEQAVEAWSAFKVRVKKAR